MTPKQQLEAMDALSEASGGLSRLERQGYRESILRLLDENAALRQEIKQIKAELERLMAPPTTGEGEPGEAGEEGEEGGEG